MRFEPPKADYREGDSRKEYKALIRVQFDIKRDNRQRAFDEESVPILIDAPRSIDMTSSQYITNYDAAVSLNILTLPCLFIDFW